MPVGSELAQRIQQGLALELQSGSRWPEGPLSDCLSRSPGLRDSHIQAMRRIESGITFKDSIDEYLDEWRDVPDMLDVGKLAISHQILKSERSTAFFLKEESSTTVSPVMTAIRDSWLGQILRYANPGVPRRQVDECLKDISFITFNYDRLLELALYWFIRYGQDQPQDAAIQQLVSIPIKHAYGSLGALPFQGGLVPLGSEAPYDVQRGASSIRTFTEESESAHRAAIQEMLREADKVVFLGFGFHPRNIELMLPEYFRSGEVRLYGTSVGLPQRVSDLLDLDLGAAGTAIQLHQTECASLLSTLRDDLFG